MDVRELSEIIRAGLEDSLEIAHHGADGDGITYVAAVDGQDFEIRVEAI